MKIAGKTGNLERKLVISFLLAAIIPILLQYFVYFNIMDMQFAKMRDERFELFRDNLISALEETKRQQLLTNIDYAHWNDMYKYSQEKNYQWFSHVFENLKSDKMGIDLIYVFNDAMESAYEFNPAKGFIEANKDYIQIAKSGIEFSTLQIINDKLYIVSYSRIVENEGQLRSGGIIVMGQALTPEKIRSFPKAYNFKADIVFKGNSIAEGITIDNYQTLLNMSIKQQESVLKDTHFYKLYDHRGDVIALMKIRETDNSAREIAKATQNGSVLIMGTMIMMILFAVTVLKNNIMRPIKELRDKVRQMRGANEEIAVSGDEITALTEEFAAMSLDISRRTTEIEEQNKVLQYLVYKDDITGAYNKRYFRQKIKEDFAAAVENKSPMCLALVDLDYFKMYRELIHVDHRNEVLSTIYSMMRKGLNKNCTICFDGTDEFRIIMADTHYKEALDAINEISESISREYFEGMEQLPEGHITVSSGIANYPSDAEDSEKLYYAARDRLNRVKLHNKGNIGYFYSIFNDIKEDIEADRKTLIYAGKAFLAVIDAMDEYTYTHTEGVVKYACLIAEQLGLDDEEIENIRIGALLHDIGKLELGRELLNKKEKLSEAEVKLIRQHPVFGMNMLKTLQYLEGVSDIVKYHHERFDGKGYPEGLAGEEIPLGARIVAVADSFDAMTTTRAYRNTQKTYQEAVEELNRCSGAQFDPKVVKTLTNYIEENGFDFRILR